MYGYDPELAPVVDVLPVIDISDVAAARSAVMAMREAAPAVALPDSVTVEQRKIAGADGDAEIDLYIVGPKQRAGELGCLYWIHGGGFVFGSAADDLPTLANIALTLGIVAVSVEY